MTVLHFDLTPCIFADDPICEQCGHYTRVTGRIDTGSGLVSIQDDISCYGGLSSYRAPAESFLEKHAAEVSQYGRAGDPYADASEYESFMDEVSRSAKTFSDPDRARALRQAILNTSESIDEVENAAIALSITTGEYTPGINVVTFYDSDGEREECLPDEDEDEIVNGYVGDFRVEQYRYAADTSEEGCALRIFRLYKKSNGYRLVETEERPRARISLPHLFTTATAAQTHIEQCAAQRGILLNSLDFTSPTE